MTIRELAKKAQVSPSTVSRYFSGAEQVSEASAQRIADVLQSEDYVPRAYESKMPHLIGVFVAHFRYGYYHEVLQQVIDGQKDFPFRMVCIPCGDDNAVPAANVVRKLRLDGAIVLEGELDPIVMEALESVKARIVFCGDHSLMKSGINIYVNDLTAGYMGMRYLLSLGHEKIAIFSDRANSINSSFQRIVGSQKALEERDIRWENNRVFYTEVTYEGGYEAATQLLQSGMTATAVFAFSDEMAFGAIAAFYDAGLRVPQDISILGYDDLPIASRMRPQLTTVHQPVKELVLRSLECMQNTVDYHYKNAIVLPCTIVERETCCKQSDQNHANH